MGVEGLFLEGSVLGRILPWFFFWGGKIVGGEVVYKGLKVWRCLEPVGWDF